MSAPRSDASLLAQVQQVFAEAPFVMQLGMKVETVREGYVESTLQLQPWQLQQDGFAHAGVVATLGDHTAGGAALSSAKESDRVLSIEFKVNFLRPAKGPRLRCKSTVLKAGRTLSVCESEIFSEGEGEPRLVSKMTVTLTLVQKTSATPA